MAKKYLAFGTAAALTLSGVALGMTASSADTQTPPAGTVSAAHGHGLYTSLFPIDVVGTANASSDFPDNAGANGDDLSVELLKNLVTLNLGTINLLLIKDPDDPAAEGLLDLGSLGAISSHAESPSNTHSVASSGLITSNGALDLQAQNQPGFESAKVDLGALLDQLLTQTVADSVLNEATIDIGALGAMAEKNNGTVASEYMVADLGVTLESPVVATLGGTVETTVNTLVGDTVAEAVGPGGLLNGVLGGLSSIINAVDTTVLGTGVRLDSDPAQTTAQVTGVSQLANSISTQLVTEGISNSDESVVINLGTGEITIDLEAFVIQAQNDPAITNLNQLPPNTPVLSSAVITAIVNGVTEALTDASNPKSLVSKVQMLLEAGIWDLGVEIKIDASGEVCLVGACTTLADGDVTIAGTLGEFTGTDGALDNSNIDVNLDLLGIVPVGDILTVVATPLLNLIATQVTGPLLTLITDDVVDALQPTLIGVVSTATSALLDPPSGALGRVLAELVQLTINEQPTAGDLGAGSFTVRALTLSVLPQVGGGITDAVDVQLGSATILAAEPAAMITATPDSVASGETVTIAGSFFTPNSPVSITIPGVATPITTTTDASGAFSATWTVPAGFATGPVIITATDGGNKTATDTVTVVEAALTANDAPQGGSVALSGTGFVPGESVTITSDLPGAPTAQPTAAVDGSITASWPVLATQAPGTYTFTATGAGGREAEDDAAVTLAVATLAAAPNPVVPGGTVTITGGNFAPGEAVTLTLPASCAVTGGTPVVADGSGNFTVTCAVGAGVADGTALNFSATGNDSGRSATAVTEVDSQPPADANTNASASAAASAQANGNNEVAAQAAALAAAMADNSTSANAAATADANAAAEAAARASVNAGASTNASATATTVANSAAQASANASADSTANANADASAAASAVGTVDARAASQASADSAADGANASATASQDATANVRADANASASASASANANGAQEAAAQAAAQAAAYSVGQSDASAAATANGVAAAETAAYTTVDADASATASADTTSAANSAAQAAAQASSAATTTAQASADQNADSNADGSFDSRSAARSAAEASSAANASAAASGGSAEAAVDAAANVQANANASASASASADADSYSNPNAQAAAQAAAFANNDNDASAAADPDAIAAAQAAARPNVDVTASATASEDAESQSLAAAQSTATASSAQAANASATATADAEASAAAAAISNASTDASQNAAADVNASASASASAQADSNANAAAQAAAETSALANASTTATASASAAATANAVAAAQAAAQIAARADVTAIASATASQDTSAQANVAANVAAQATATTDATANTSASAAARAAATANSSAAAQAAANQAAFADSTADASASAAANARASVTASPSAQAASQGVANASGGQKLVNTGAAIGGITAAALVLLLIGSIVLVSAQRRKNLV